MIIFLLLYVEKLVKHRWWLICLESIHFIICDCYSTWEQLLLYVQWPIIYRRLLYILGQEVLDMHYVIPKFMYSPLQILWIATKNIYLKVPYIYVQKSTFMFFSVLIFLSLKQNSGWHFYTMHLKSISLFLSNKCT